MIRNFMPIWIVFFYVFSCTSTSLIIFIVSMYCYIEFLDFYILVVCLIHIHMFIWNQLITFLYLIYSFLCIMSLPMHVSIESIDCIFLSLPVLNAILLTSSVNTLCFSLLYLRSGFNINLLLFS